jgi:hypothetical protein
MLVWDTLIALHGDTHTREVINMAASPSLAIDAEEVRFAQLACLRLARRLHGTLSVGLPAVVNRWPQARPFLDDNFRELAAFAVVLGAVYAKPEAKDDTLRLREKARDVSAALEELHRRLLAPLDSVEPPSAALRAARTSAATLCDAIAEFARLIELDGAPVAKVKSVVLQVFDALDGLKAAV